MKALFPVCLFLKAAVRRHPLLLPLLPPPPHTSSSLDPPRIEMDDLSDKGNRFQHFVIRQHEGRRRRRSKKKKNARAQMRRSLHVSLRKGRDTNREMSGVWVKKSRKLKEGNGRKETIRARAKSDV